MPSSRVLTFSDPYDYAKSARGAHVKTFVTTRGNFAGKMAPISLHRLWMNRSEASLPHIKHVALDGRRSGISFLAGDQPIEYLGGPNCRPARLPGLAALSSTGAFPQVTAGLRCH
jgi:hypothetical protein